LLSRIGLEEPFGIGGVAGATTLRPGICASQLSHAWMLRAELERGPARAPEHDRDPNLPTDMYSIFAAELMI